MRNRNIYCYFEKKFRMIIIIFKKVLLYDNLERSDLYI